MTNWYDSILEKIYKIILTFSRKLIYNALLSFFIYYIIAMQNSYQNIYNEYLQKLAELNEKEQKQIESVSFLQWELFKKVEEKIVEMFKLQKEELANSSPYQEAILYRQQMIEAWEALVQAKRESDKDRLQVEKSGIEQELSTKEQECGSIQARLEKERRDYENAKAAYEATERLYKDTKSALDGLRQELNTVTEKERKYNEEVNNKHGRYIAAAETFWISVMEAISTDDIRDLIIPEISERPNNEEQFVNMYDYLVKKSSGEWWLMPADIRSLLKTFLGNPDWSFDELMDAIYWKETEIGSELEWSETVATSSENVDNVLPEWKMSTEAVVKYLSELDQSKFMVEYIDDKSKKLRLKCSWAYHILLDKNDKEPVRLMTQLANLCKNPRQAIDIIIRAPLRTGQMKKFLSTAYSKVNKRDIDSILQWLSNVTKPWKRWNMQSVFLSAFNVKLKDIGSDDCPDTPFVSWWTCSWTWKKQRK